MAGKKTVKTRKESYIWLIGYPEMTLLGKKQLPTYRQILSLFFYRHMTLKETVRESSKNVVREVLVLWNKSRIPTTIERNAIEKLENMFHRWIKLKKSQKRISPSQELKENNFKADIDKLFDIAHANALSLIRIPEDKVFLEDQRSERKLFIGGIDKCLEKKEKKSLRRKTREKELIDAEKERKNMCQLVDVVELSSVEESSSCDEEPSRSSKVKMPLRKKNPEEPDCIISPEVASALDRTNISDRKATFILAATAQALGHDISNIPISRTSIRTARIKQRTIISKNVKEKFVASNIKVPLTVHWDGKILTDITGKESVERLPVLVSGYEIKKLLGVPKLANGTGRTAAQAVLKTIGEWGIEDKVKSMSFDTTAVNSGVKNGACAQIVNELGRDLLHLACRHHIHEIVISDVFNRLFGASSGPNIPIFSRFKEKWSSIDKESFNTALDDEKCIQIMRNHNDLKTQVLDFCLKALQSTVFPRDDYRELLELTVIFLGSTPPREIRFMAPGALHRARWMAKILYCFKLWMFKRQFKLTTSEETSLRRICLFASLVYTRNWILAPLPTSSAPVNDLRFLKSASKYADIDKDVSTVTLRAFGRHLWYLSEELIALAFFDKETKVETKRKMVEALKTPGSEDDSPKRIKIEINDIHIQSRQLDSFVSANTLNFFKILGLPYNFLTDSDPSDWETLEEFVEAERCAASLQVVNDTAERGVKLIQDFNRSITNNEEQKQILLQEYQNIDLSSLLPKSHCCLSQNSNSFVVRNVLIL